jgi:hypothetical protein
MRDVVKLQIKWYGTILTELKLCDSCSIFNPLRCVGVRVGVRVRIRVGFRVGIRVGVRVEIELDLFLKKT